MTLSAPLQMHSSLRCPNISRTTTDMRLRVLLNSITFSSMYLRPVFSNFFFLGKRTKTNHDKQTFSASGFAPSREGRLHGEKRPLASRHSLSKRPSKVGSRLHQSSLIWRFGVVSEKPGQQKRQGESSLTCSVPSRVPPTPCDKR
jgi:hypothetical protein